MFSSFTYLFSLNSTAASPLFKHTSNESVILVSYKLGTSSMFAFRAISKWEKPQFLASQESQLEPISKEI